VAKVGTSNSDRTISLRLQCVVRKRNVDIRSEVTDELHASVALHLGGRGRPVPTVQEGGWVLETV